MAALANRLLLVLLAGEACAGLLSACSSPRNGRTPEPSTKTREITLFFTTELFGTMEPCGCTSDPLGDLSRTARVLAEARKERPVAYFDGGSTLFGDRAIPDEARPQELKKGALLAELLPKIGLSAAALGDKDLRYGIGYVRIPRQAANVRADSGIPIDPPRIVDIGGVQVGVFGVVSKSALQDPKIVVTDPIDAAQNTVRDLRGRGAELVIALAHVRRPEARQLARGAPGIDIILVGQEAPDPAQSKMLPAPEQVGNAWLIQPANRGQILARLDLGVARGGPLVDAIGKDRADRLVRAMTEKIAELEKNLTAWREDPGADKAFVEQKKQALQSMKKERDELIARPLRRPDQGSWFVLAMIPVKRGLPCDEKIQSAKQRHDQEVAQANLKAAADEKPLPVPKGKAGYSGIEECEYCHKAAVEFWEKTRHAQAWETLERIGKQFDRECIGCHVTGWQKPGGSTLAHNESLRDVQCESCHEPASIHVDADGKEKPKSLVVLPPENLCTTTCHTPEHSDTFDTQAYMRDITGHGHGEKFKKTLGIGPTGHELRSAALKKSGKGLGEGCAR